MSERVRSLKTVPTEPRGKGTIFGLLFIALSRQALVSNTRSAQVATRDEIEKSLRRIREREREGERETI